MEMSGEAKRNVEIVSRGNMVAAEQCRQRTDALMTDARLTEAERAQGRDGLLQLADKLEAQARWWTTGEGPCP